MRRARTFKVKSSKCYPRFFTCKTFVLCPMFSPTSPLLELVKPRSSWIWDQYLVTIVLQSQVWALSCLVHKSVSQPDILLTNQTMLNLESKVITVFSKLLHALVKVINTHLSKLLYVFVKVVSVADYPSCQTKESQSLHIPAIHLGFLSCKYWQDCVWWWNLSLNK